ncbi:hypothetical protein GCM10025767_19740 [Thalassotalea piscium]
MNNTATPAITYQINDQIKCKAMIVGQEKNIVLVIDDFSQNPSELVNAFINRNTHIKVEGDKNHYPGIHAEVNTLYTQQLYLALKPLIKEYYKLPVAYLEHIRSDFSIVLTRPEELNQEQCIPHYDSLGKGHIAVLHYLCHPPYLGTGFYRHKATGYESINRTRLAQYSQIIEKNIENKIFKNDYINRGNEHYELIDNVELKFNRLVVYPSQMLHSSLIDSKLITDDFDKGRLTLRTFLHF